MQSEEIQIKTTKLSLYLLKSENHEDEWFKEHHVRIIDDCTKRSVASSFIGQFLHPVEKSEHLYVSFVTKENLGNQGLRYPIRAICYLNQKSLIRRASKEVKQFLKQTSFRDCPSAILDEILRYVAETFPGAPVTELEAL